MAKALVRRVEDVVDADLVIRSQPFTASRMLVIAIVTGIVGIWHKRLYNHPRPWVPEPADILILFIVLGLAMFKYVVVPPWIRLGRGGLAFGEGLRERRFSWSQIRWFNVQSERGLYHHRPPWAYVVLDRPSGFWSPDAVRLPRVSGYSAEGLVAFLEEKRHLYRLR